MVVDRRPQAAGVDVVRADSEGGALELGRLLVGLGHRRMAVLSGPASVPTAVDRVAGFRRALVDEAGLPAPPVLHGAFSIESGHAMTLSAMRRCRVRRRCSPPTTSSPSASCTRSRSSASAVPDDVAVVGFDDLPRAMVTFPFLTVAAQPAFEMGRRAVAVLLDRLANPGARRAQDVVLPTELVIRRSSGGPRRPDAEVTA